MRRAAAAALVVLVVLGALLGAAAPAAAVGAPFVPSGAPYFGAILDWAHDGAAPYAARLGAGPAVLGQSVRFPLTAADDRYLTQYAEQVGRHHAIALLDVDPAVPLATLTTGDADALTARLGRLHHDLGVAFELRFGPEMNGSWTAWGQQPSAYRAAFSRFAAAVHRALPRDVAAVVWSPTYGAGYPFATASGRVAGSGPRPKSELDTDRDGAVTDADDAYAPYWPGDDAVDLVGLSVYDYGPPGHVGTDAVPAPGRFAAQLAGRYGYQHPAGAGRDFLAEYSTGRHHPAIVETAALYDPRGVSPDAEPAAELAVKQAWWRQVFAAVTSRAHPGIAAVVWLEVRRAEPEVGDQPIDWRVTTNRTLSAELRADLRDNGLTLGPVTSPGHGGRTVTPWVIGGAAAVVVAVVAGFAAARRRRPAPRS